MTVFSVDSCTQSDSIHLVSQRPEIDRLYAVFSAAICADLPASYLVLTYHVPINVVALEVRRRVASFRLSLWRVIRVPNETSSPHKTDVTLCVIPTVFVITSARVPLARRLFTCFQLHDVDDGLDH